VGSGTSSRFLCSETGAPLNVTFRGRLTDLQTRAAGALLAHDTGIFIAPPGVGKTVVGIHLIAARARNTLVLVHRRPLLEQWVAQLSLFLGLDREEIGQLAAAKRKLTGRVDVAMIQSLVRKDGVDDLVAGYGHVIVARETAFQGPPVNDAQASIQDLYRALASDEARNQLIVADIEAALAEGRNPIVLTERRDHLEFLASALERSCPHVIVMQGGAGAKERRAIVQKLATVPANEARVVVATGKYAGEGFDDARLDTLFLTMPVAWKGSIVQYTGRLHRLQPGKEEVRIYDYVDRAVPMLARMFEKRRKAYRAIGYGDGQANLFTAHSTMSLGRLIDGGGPVRAGPRSHVGPLHPGRRTGTVMGRDAASSSRSRRRQDPRRFLVCQDIS
jgi:superfamily II DNA or RNA helicase